MILKEKPSLTKEDYQRISEIFELVEWEKRAPSEIKDAFDKSTCTTIVWEDNTLVGFGRTFDDGKYYATICDVAIDPKYQGKGIGTQIMNSLRAQLEGFLFITLTAAPGKGAFYEKIGWKKQTSAYISPVSELQEKQHT